MKLRISEILEFYDVPQLFIALDSIGTSYLCLFYDYDENGRMLCISANISAERLNDFITGHIDLRRIYLEPEMDLFDVIVDNEIINATIRTTSPTDVMLPEEGYVVNYSQRENREMIKTAVKENKTVIHIAFNYDTNNHSVPIDVLTNTAKNFQSLLNDAFKKVTKSNNTDCSQLFAVATPAASFDLVLYANESLNLFGGSKVADTLNLLSPLFGEDDAAVANCLATFKNTQRSYKNLMKTLAERNVSFKCKWVHETVSSLVYEYPITQERIHSLYSLASNLKMLEERDVEFEGKFFMANVRNGRWGLELEGHERPKYGVCIDADVLVGVVLKDQLYKVKCTEKPSQNPNTGKVYSTFVLTDIEKLF